MERGGGRGPGFAVEAGPVRPDLTGTKDGVVAAQDPAPGTPAPLRSTVTIIAWAGLSPVPDVVGKSMDNARAALNPGGRFTVQFGPPPPPVDPGKDGTVAKQDPVAGAIAPQGSTVTRTLYERHAF